MNPSRSARSPACAATGAPAAYALNSVAPAFTQTEATAGVGTDEESLAPFVNRIALGRPGQPEDIAPAVLFLASADAAYITGTTLTVDGGTSATRASPTSPAVEDHVVTAGRG